MARGNNFTLASGSGTLQKMLTGDIRQSALVLNPNDGVLYVVQNSQASATAWDFIVPSQSYAALPGPWESIGLWYVDQSGAGRSGNVTVYESDNRLDVPIYQAIGIARLAQQGTMDIVEGTIPANPSAGILRLWADATDHLHELRNNGIDVTVLTSADAITLSYIQATQASNYAIPSGQADIGNGISIVVGGWYLIYYYAVILFGGLGAIDFGVRNSSPGSQFHLGTNYAPVAGQSYVPFSGAKIIQATGASLFFAGFGGNNNGTLIASDPSTGAAATVLGALRIG